jgi:hypothetical protein
VLAACTVNRPVAVELGPVSLDAYFRARHPADVLVTDSLGRTQWMHHPRIDGDTLHGLRSRELPRKTLAIAVAQVKAIAVPRVSVGRTLGLIGGTVTAVAISIAALAGSGRNQPLH